MYLKKSYIANEKNRYTLPSEFNETFEKKYLQTVYYLSGMIKATEPVYKENKIWVIPTAVVPPKNAIPIVVVLFDNVYKEGSLPECSIVFGDRKEGNYVYEFEGWNPEIAPVTEKASYQVKYGKNVEFVFANAPYTCSAFYSDSGHVSVLLMNNNHQGNGELKWQQPKFQILSIRRSWQTLLKQRLKHSASLHLMQRLTLPFRV